MDQWIVNSDDKLEFLVAHIRAEYAKHHYLNVEMSNGKQRTSRQNNALHVWLSMVAKSLNDQGRDMKKTLKADVEIPWTTQTAKDHLWRPVQIAVCGQESTVDAAKVDYLKVFEVLNRHFGEKFQLHIPWPVKHES